MAIIRILSLPTCERVRYKDEILCLENLMENPFNCNNKKSSSYKNVPYTATSLII